MPLVNLPWLMQHSATNFVRYFRNRLTLCLTALIGNRVLDHHRESVATPNPHLSNGELKKKQLDVSTNETRVRPCMGITVTRQCLPTAEKCQAIHPCLLLSVKLTTSKDF
jgi:hypothetical protein